MPLPSAESEPSAQLLLLISTPPSKLSLPFSVMDVAPPWSLSNPLPLIEPLTMTLVLVPPVKVSGLESRVMLPFITSDDPETAPKPGTVALLLSATRPETRRFRSKVAVPVLA